MFDAEILGRRGWDRAFVTVLDEGPVERCLAVLGHATGADPGEGWEARRIKTKAKGAKGKTEDCEACAGRDGRIYVVGSQFGSKSGPLEAKRHFVARLAEADVLRSLDGAKPALDLVRLRFRLHRAINDALARAGTPLLPLGPATRRRYIDATIREGARKGKSWDGRVISADWPVNVEGAAFRPNGTMLLGLRHPVTADGAPLLVELPDVDALFDDPEAPIRCANVWVLTGVGRRERPVGVRALHAEGNDRFSAIVGNLDATDKDSTLLEDHPEGGDAHSAHVRFGLPLLAAGGEVITEHVREFPGLKKVEGLAAGEQGRMHYVVDEEGRVQLRTLFAAEAAPA